MRIAVFGASSGIGRELVLQARTGGHHAVAVARGAAASLTPIKGSVLDPGVAERAVAGADAVAWCVGVRTLGPAFLRKVTVFSEGTRRAIEAMKEAGVSRLAVITGIGAGESRGHGGLLYEWIGLPLIVGGIYALMGTNGAESCPLLSRESRGHGQSAPALWSAQRHETHQQSCCLAKHGV